MSDIKTNSPEVKLTIRTIGSKISDLDVLRSDLSRESAERKKLDDDRDILDAHQRRLVRNEIDTNTKEFNKLVASLEEVNDELEKTIDDVTKTADTLKNLVKFIAAVEKIVNLIPK